MCYNNRWCGKKLTKRGYQTDTDNVNSQDELQDSQLCSQFSNNHFDTYQMNSSYTQPIPCGLAHGCNENELHDCCKQLSNANAPPAKKRKILTPNTNIINSKPCQDTKYLNSSHMYFTQKVFGIHQLLIEIFSCLDFLKILKYRRINVLTNKLFCIKYYIVKMDMYNKYSLCMSYNSSLFKKLIERDICSNHRSFASWYLQSLNYDVAGPVLMPYISSTSITCAAIDHFDHDHDNFSSIKIQTNKTEVLFDVYVNKKNIRLHWSPLSREYTESYCQVDAQYKCLGERRGNSQTTQKKKEKTRKFKVFITKAINGKIYLNMFEKLCLNLKYIKKCMKNKTYWTNGLIDILILGHLFDIIPMKPHLNHLLTVIKINDPFYNKNFRKIKTPPKKMRRCRISERNFELHSHCEMGWLWQCLGSKWMQNFFINEIQSRKHGYSSLYAKMALKGDFSWYCSLNDKEKSELLLQWRGFIPSRNDLHVSNGFVTLMALYLRNDLISQYIHPYNYSTNRDNIHHMQILRILLQPKIVLHLKTKFEDLKISLTEKDLYSFNLFENPNMFPYQRIKFLKTLCFASTFAASIDSNKYPMDLCQGIKKLIDNFDYFQNEWYLNKYLHLKNNILKQKKLHQQFCFVMQALLGLCKFTRRVWYQKPHCKVLNNKYFVDIRCQSEQDVETLYNHLIDANCKSQSLQNPKVNVFTQRMLLSDVDDMWLVFPHVRNPHLFLLKLYNMQF